MAIFCRDIGLNLFSDAIGLWFGIFVIDKLLEKERSDNEAPARLAAWRSISRLHSNIVQFIDLCVEHHWTIDVAQDLWQAHLQQRAHFLGQMLATLRIDPVDKSPASRVGSGRFAVDAYFTKAVREADRFSSRYVTFADPSIVELVERFESLTLTEGLTSWGPNISHIGSPVWDQLFEVEVELRRALLEASTRYADDLLPPPRLLLKDIERWMRVSAGWSDEARAAVARPDISPDK